MDPRTSGLKDTVKLHCPTCTEKYGFDRIDGASMGYRNVTPYSNKGYSVLRYPFKGKLYCRYPDWGYPVSRYQYQLFRGYSLQAYPLKVIVIQRLVRVDESSRCWFIRLPKLGI